jgi:predicted transcriptional regulator
MRDIRRNQISIRLDDATFARVQALAYEERKTLAELARTALEKALGASTPRQ